MSQPACTAIEVSFAVTSVSEPSGSVMTRGGSRRRGPGDGGVDAADDAVEHGRLRVRRHSSLSSVRTRGDVERRQHADRALPLPIHDDQMRGAVLGHQLGRSLERLVGRNHEDRRTGGPAGALVVEIAHERSCHEVEIGDDAPGRARFAAAAVDDDAVDELPRHRGRDLGQRCLSLAGEHALVHRVCDEERR